MKRLWWFGWSMLCIIRALLLVRMISNPGWSNFALFIVEAFALYYGVCNAIYAKERFASWVGLWPAAAYALGLGLLPQQGFSLNVVGALLLISGMVLSGWGLFALGSRFSVGPTAFVSLCDWGPYKWIRHPQLTARMMMICAVAVSCPGVTDQLRCVVALLVTFSVVRAEESCLSLVPSWQAYKKRVRFVSIPGVC